MQKMKKLIILLFLSFFLFSCNWETDKWGKENEKKDYFIDLKAIDDFDTSVYLEKVWKIKGSQEIQINAQASGRIGNIFVKEGQRVIWWQTLIALQDTIASYGIALERAKNALDRAQINYEATLLSLDKQVFDSEIAFEKLQTNYNNLKKTTELDISQAEENLKNAEYKNMDSASALQLQKMDNAIAKLELDYDNSLVANKETIETFKITLRKEYNSLSIFLSDVVDFGDKLLWITDKYDDVADKYDTFLGGKNKLQRKETEESLRELIRYEREDISNISFENIDDEKLIAYLSTLNQGYEKIKKYLDNFEETFQQSIPSMGTLSEAEISAYNTTVNAYQTQLQASLAWFLAYYNNATSFLRTYKNSEESLLKQIGLQKNEREILKKSLETSLTQTQTGLDKVLTSSEDTISSLSFQLKSAEKTMEDAKKNREITLKSLENAIKEAEISYSSALKEYSKLTISSPISGIVSSIQTDIGQDVAPWTPLISIVGDASKEIEIGLKEKELDCVSLGQEISITMGEKTFSGTLYSVSSVADQNLNYNANVVFDEEIGAIGGIVDLRIPVSSSYPLVPINILEISSENKALIPLYIWEQIVKKEVNIGHIYWDVAEIIFEEEDGFTDYKVVVNDIANFDAKKFNLKVNSEEEKKD